MRKKIGHRVGRRYNVEQYVGEGLRFRGGGWGGEAEIF